MGRYDLTDFEWCVIEPLLPNKPRGVPYVDDRHSVGTSLRSATGRMRPAATAGARRVSGTT